MTKASDEKVIVEARKRFQQCKEYESPSRARYMDDVRFGNGDSQNLYQWPESIAQSRMRMDKPLLTVNRTRQYCNNILNDSRQNKPEIRIRPVGNGATFKAATIMEGLVRHIEYISNAQQAYDCASWGQVYGGIGWFRIVTDYAHDSSFDQEIFIRRIPDALSVYLDPAIIEYDGSDAMFGFVFRDLSRQEFERDYPKYKDSISTAPLGESPSDPHGWLGKDRVRIAEYYRVVHESDTLHYLPDGNTMTESEAKPGQLDDLRATSIQSREVDARKVEWYLIVGSEVVDQRDWPGKYIPLVRVVGEETVIDGQLDRKGHVRALIDAQRAYNYYTSAGIEFVALQSKTPWVAPVASIEGYETDWAQSNQVNLAVLPYNHMDDAGHEIPKPAREEPPVFAPAYLEGTKLAAQEMEVASGQSEATFGLPSNERSGKAIDSRARNAATSTYHYVDHLSTAIKFAGKIIIDLIPKIYDTPRTMKILGQDGTASTVQIDPAAMQGHQAMPPPKDGETFDPTDVSSIFNPSVGEFDVVSEIGPSYSTRRLETFNALTQILSQNESLTPLIGDLLFRNSDFNGADEIADRMKAMVPPHALGLGPDPQVQQLQQQLAQQHQVMAQMGQELAQSKSKAMGNDMQKDIDWFKAETERMKVVSAVDPAAMMPIIRQMVSEVLGTPINPIIAAHAAENAQMAQAATPQVSAPQQPQQPQPGPAQ
jgi:hypothetical protein